MTAMFQEYGAFGWLENHHPGSYIGSGMKRKLPLHGTLGKRIAGGVLRDHGSNFLYNKT